MGRLKTTQELILVSLVVLSVLQSVLGSSAIIYSILKLRRLSSSTRPPRTGGESPERSCTYHRIMLCMCTFDLLFSSCLAIQPFLTPKGAYNLSVGNQTTCAIMGAMNQIGLAGCLYYCMLNAFFLLTIRYQISQITMAERVEPFMHLIAVGWPVITGVAGSVVGVYDSLDLYQACWITNFPKDCHSNDSVQCISDQIAWALGGPLYFLLVVAVVVNNSLIYSYVRKTYQRAFQPGWNHSAVHSELSLTNTTIGGETTSFRLSPQSGAAHQRRIRLVASQCFYYIGAGFTVYTPVFLGQALESAGFDNQTQLFPFMVLQAITTPLAGFFNAIIYFRPQYLALLHDGLSRPQAAYQAIVGKQVTNPRWRTSVQSNTALRGGETTEVQQAADRDNVIVEMVEDDSLSESQVSKNDSAAAESGTSDTAHTTCPSDATCRAQNDGSMKSQRA